MQLPQVPECRGSEGSAQGEPASRPLHPHQRQQQREALPASGIVVNGYYRTTKRGVVVRL